MPARTSFPRAVLGLFLAFILSGCAPAEPAPPLQLPEPALELCFSSGAGAWSTWMTLYGDGSFEGAFHDSNMGESGEGYPNGTVYTSRFRGKFVLRGQPQPHVYELELEQLENLSGQTEPFIQQGVRYVPSDPYGLEGGRQFFLYLPDTPVEGLNEEFLSWWPNRFDAQPPRTLSRYGLYNVEMECGFFS